GVGRSGCLRTRRNSSWNERGGRGMTSSETIAAAWRSAPRCAEPISNAALLRGRRATTRRSRLLGVAARLVASAFVICAATTASAETVIKLGTIAPEGSVWHDTLLEIRQQWRDISGGEVELRIYAGGVLGGEDEMVRKMQ